MPLKLKPTVLDRLKELEGDAKAKRISEALPILAKNSSKQLVPIGGGTSSGDDGDVSNFRDTISVDIGTDYLGEFFSVLDGGSYPLYKSDASYSELEYFGVTMQNMLYGESGAETVQYAPSIVLLNNNVVDYVFQAIKQPYLEYGTSFTLNGDDMIVSQRYHHGNCPLLKVAYLQLGEDDAVFYHSAYIVPKDAVFEQTSGK